MEGKAHERIPVPKGSARALEFQQESDPLQAAPRTPDACVEADPINRAQAGNRLPASALSTSFVRSFDG